jgi:hypothetical protein
MEAASIMHDARRKIAAAIPAATGDRLTQLQQLDARAAVLEGVARRGRGGPASTESGPKSFSQLQNEYGTCLGLLEEADAAPTVAVQTALRETIAAEQTTAAALVKFRKDALTLNIEL